jgi:hypothetical protein
MQSIHHSVKTIANNRPLSRAGHSVLVAIAPAVVFPIVTTLSTSVKKKMRHTETFFTPPSSPLGKQSFQSRACYVQSNNVHASISNKRFNQTNVLCDAMPRRCDARAMTSRDGNDQPCSCSCLCSRVRVCACVRVCAGGGGRACARRRANLYW